MNDLPFDPLRLTWAHLDRAIGIVAPHAPHYAELLRVVRSGRLALAEVRRDAAWPKREIEATRKPVLAMIADDDGFSSGPAGFRSANAACRWPRAAIVHAAAAEPGQYKTLAALAVLVGRLLLVETGSAQAEAWVAALSRHQVPVTTILPRDGVHPVPGRGRRCNDHDDGGGEMNGAEERPDWWRAHYEDGSTEFAAIGKDPRSLSVAELEAFGHRKEPLLRLIRRNCIDCAGGSEAEVRRCAIVACPFWPYRMSTNPFAAERSDEQKAAAAERMRRLHARRAEFARSSCETDRQEPDVEAGGYPDTPQTPDRLPSTTGDAGTATPEAA